MTIDSAVLSDPASFMRLAIDEARAAASAGEVPVGAIGVVDGRIVARAGNRRERDRDPTGHAELIVVRELATRLGEWRLEQATVVVTLEPCPMCAGALWAARVGGAVFGAWDPKAGATGSIHNLAADARLNHEYPVVGGVLADECSALLSEFFRQAR